MCVYIYIYIHRGLKSDFKVLAHVQTVTQKRCYLPLQTFMHKQSLRKIKELCKFPYIILPIDPSLTRL